MFDGSLNGRKLWSCQFNTHKKFIEAEVSNLSGFGHPCDHSLH